MDIFKQVTRQYVTYEPNVKLESYGYKMDVKQRLSLSQRFFTVPATIKIQQVKKSNLHAHRYHMGLLFWRYLSGI